AAYRVAVALQPDFAEAYVRLGTILGIQGNSAEALACFERAAEVQPDSVFGLIGLATARTEARQVAAAEECVRRAIALAPHNAEAQMLAGNILSRLGRFADANACCETAIRLDPRRTFSYYNLVSNKKITAADRPLIEQMTRLLVDENLPDRDRTNLHFALGKSFDDLAEYESAMRHFDEANRIEAERVKQAGGFLDRDLHAAENDAAIAMFTPELFAAREPCGSQSELPIFIVGMPRSGTTLTEQIISSHPEV